MTSYACGHTPGGDIAHDNSTLKVGRVVPFAIQGHTVFSPEAMRKLEHDHAESIDICSNTKNRTTASLETHDKCKPTGIWQWRPITLERCITFSECLIFGERIYRGHYSICFILNSSQYYPHMTFPEYEQNEQLPIF